MVYFGIFHVIYFMYIVKTITWWKLCHSPSILGCFSCYVNKLAAAAERDGWSQRSSVFLHDDLVPHLSPGNMIYLLMHEGYQMDTFTYLLLNSLSRTDIWKEISNTPTEIQFCNCHYMVTNTLILKHSLNQMLVFECCSGCTLNKFC